MAKKVFQFNREAPSGVVQEQGFQTGLGNVDIAQFDALSVAAPTMGAISVPPRSA